MYRLAQNITEAPHPRKQMRKNKLPNVKIDKSQKKKKNTDAICTKKKDEVVNRIR